MDSFIINVSFATDIITNSSSVVYSTAMGNLDSFIDEVFIASGVDKKCSDVFDVLVMPDVDIAMDKARADVANEYGFSDSIALVDSTQGWSEKALVWRGEIINRVKLGTFPDKMMESDGWYGDDYTESSYLVLLKNGDDTNLGKLVASLFSHEASYDG